MEQLNNLELMLINGLIQKYPFLKSHIPYLRVKERKITGVGMYVNFEYINSEQELNFENINALFSGEEKIQIKSLKKGLSYVIDITDGKILYIEFITYNETWNGKFGDYKIIEE